MKTTLAAALLLACGFAVAQETGGSNTAAPAPAAATDSKTAEKSALRKDWEAQKAQMKELHAQEKAAIDAVKADASKSADEKKTAIKQIRADYKTKKDAIRAQMKADRHKRREMRHEGK